MWYLKLLEPLILKVTPHDQYQAKLFLNNLLLQIHFDAYDENIPADLIFGLINASHKIFKSRKDNSVALVEFSRVLFGLTIIYTKSSYDEAVWSDDFELIWGNPRMITIMDSPSVYELEKMALTLLNYSIHIDFEAFLAIISQNEFKYLNSEVFNYYNQDLLLDEEGSFSNFLHKINALNDKNKPLAINSMFFQADTKVEDHLNVKPEKNPLISR